MNFHPTEEALISLSAFLISNFNRLPPPLHLTNPLFPIPLFLLYIAMISFPPRRIFPRFLSYTRAISFFFLFFFCAHASSKYCFLRRKSAPVGLSIQEKKDILLYSLLMVNLALILHSTGSRSPNSKLAETLHRPIRSLTFPEESTLGVSVKGVR